MRRLPTKALWFDETSNGLGTASFEELAKITSLEIDLNKYSETNTQQDNVLIAGSTSSGAISGSFAHLDRAEINHQMLVHSLLILLCLISGYQ